MSCHNARFIVALVFALGSVPVRAATPADSPKISAGYGRIPLSFEANQGQSDPQVRFLARGRGYGIFLTGREAVLSLSKPDRNAKLEPSGKAQGPGIAGKSVSSASGGHGSQVIDAVRDAVRDVVRLELPGSRPEMNPVGEDRLPGAANYFIGNDPSKWRTGVPTYARVRYAGVYDGIDLVYYGNQRQLEYDFVVSPHADPAQIRLHFDGARKLRLTLAGDLEVTGLHGQIVFHKPELYQEAGGTRQPVEGSFAPAANHTVQFKVGHYNPERPLTIDPVLVYSTYLGGSYDDGANAIAVDRADNVYLAGYTFSDDFPVTGGAFLKINEGYAKGVYSAFITKFNASGSALLYSTYLEGSFGAIATAIAVDSAGNAYVAGWAGSSDFPVTGGAFQTKYAGGFITKLNPSGSGLVYSTYLGGSSQDSAAGIAVDEAGYAYVAGEAVSLDFPVTSGAFQKRNNNKYGGRNAFVSKLNSSGSGLVYSTYLGGSGLSDEFNGHTYDEGDYANAIAVDKAGNAYLAGAAYSKDFPVTSGAFQKKNRNKNGFDNAFITKLNSSGSALVYSTYLGGSGHCFIDSSTSGCDPSDSGDNAVALAVDSKGNTYSTGSTSSSDFPVTVGALQTTNPGGISAFVTKLNPSGSALLYSTYLGGSSGASASTIAVDLAGSAVVAGGTNSADFPVTDGAFQSSNNNALSTGFITKLNASASALLYSTFFGGSWTGRCCNTEALGSIDAIALDFEGNAYVTGQTDAFDFPVTNGAFQRTNRSRYAFGPNAFAAKMNLLAETETLLLSSVDPATVGAKVTFTATVSAGPGTPSGNVTFTIDGKNVGTETLNSAGRAAHSTKSLTLGKHTIKAAYAGNADYTASPSSVLTETIVLPQAAAPIFSPAVGTFKSAQQVTLSDKTPGARIHYTTDGKTTPTSSSPVYAGPITVAKTTTIMAMARANGHTNSVVAKGTYTIHLPPKVTTQAASTVTSSSAMLNASINDHDLKGAAIFAWGTSKTDLTSKSAAISLDAARTAQSVSVPISGLQPKTIYYFQPTAKNAGGTTKGAVFSFTTD